MHFPTEVIYTGTMSHRFMKCEAGKYLRKQTFQVKSCLKLHKFDQQINLQCLYSTLMFLYDNRVFRVSGNLRDYHHLTSIFCKETLV